MPLLNPMRAMPSRDSESSRGSLKRSEPSRDSEIENLKAENKRLKANAGKQGQKGKGRGKPNDRRPALGQAFAKLPPQLIGMNAEIDGERVCFGYNPGSCKVPGKKCPKGLHNAWKEVAGDPTHRTSARCDYATRGVQVLVKATKRRTIIQRWLMTRSKESLECLIVSRKTLKTRAQTKTKEKSSRQFWQRKWQPGVRKNW